MNINRRKFIALGSVAAANVSLLSAKNIGVVLGNEAIILAGLNELKNNFIVPPNSTKSSCYWWWFNGLVDKEGITLDMQQYQAKGMGEVLLVNSAGGLGGVPFPQGAAFLSDEWKALYRHAMSEAKNQGVPVGINLCSGWCMGGPWIKPENSGRWYLQSEMSVSGPQKFSGKLPLPGNRAGYDNIFNPPGFKDYIDLPLEQLDYRDTAIIAIPELNNNRITGERAKVLAAKTNHKDASNFIRAVDVMAPVLTEWHPEKFDNAIGVTQIIDLTQKVTKEGHLEWEVPAGKWKIIRTGHRMTGSKVSIAQPGGDGLSVDWFDHTGVDLQFENLGRVFIDEAAKVGAKPKYFCDDSFEDGFPNWTENMLARFKEYRGYDATPYLPVLSGYIVGSADIADRFLNDYRKTLSDCMADEHYGHFAKLCHHEGILMQNEAAGPSRSGTMCMDGLKNLGRSDFPMGEFWLPPNQEDQHNLDDDKPYGTSRLDFGQNKVTKMTASASHIYGRKTASAEAFTSFRHWVDYPGSLKQALDRAFCEGINRIAIHTSTAQRPQDGKPGYEYGAGTHFNPNVTWWEKSKPFFDYVGRCQYLLRSGKFVADVLFYNGDVTPNLAQQKHIDPSLGKGYDYDDCNEEVLLTRVSVEDGRLMLPDGMSYRVLVLPDTNRMPVNVLKKIAALVKGGATIVGHPPKEDSGLKNYPHCDAEIITLAKQVWGNIDGLSTKLNRFGKGRVFQGETIRNVLLKDGILPDFEHDADNGIWIDFIHRTTPEAEVYFITNRHDKIVTANCTFRVKNRTPEIWDPVTATINKKVGYKVATGRIEIPLRFDVFQSYCVIFPKNSPAPQSNQLKNYADLKALKDLTGPWKVEFDTKWGGPEAVEFASLQDWSASNDDRIKYFSGKAVYTKKFDFVKDSAHKQLFIDLGVVKNIADVTINGVHLGVVWTAPWRVDVSSVLKTGENTIRIEVINLWTNRLIADAALPPEKRLTNTNIQIKKDAPLLPSGLIGPVVIQAGE